MWNMHSIVHIIQLPWRSFGNGNLPFVKQKVFISSLSNNIYCNAQIRIFLLLYFGGLNHLILLKNDKITILVFLVQRRLFPNNLHGNNNMYIKVHIPPYHRCSKFENILPIVFVNFILVYVRLRRHTLSNLHMSKT